MTKFNWFLIFFSGLLFLSCELDELVVSDDLDLPLYFSTDTVLFDTLLTDRASITKRLRIFNPNSNAINIAEISLGKGSSSDYSILINGKAETSVENEILFGGDSLLILIEVEIDPKNESSPYLVKDSVNIHWNNNSANVKLIAWGQDAVYLGRGVICDVQFTADKPYVFYDSVLVDVDCEMRIAAGSRLYFDKNASLLVAGKLTAIGDSGNWITFRNSRFDENYRVAPGQWAGIHFVVGSTDNKMDYTIIENSITGITVGSPDDDTIPDLTIEHSIIRHSSNVGVAAFTSDILGRNLLVYNAGSHTIFNVAGGHYRYEHCTFVNSPNFFFQDDPSVIFSNFLQLDETNTISEALNLTLFNNVIWGSSELEFYIGDDGGAEMITSVKNNLIRSIDEISDNYTSTEENFAGFIDPDHFDYQLDSASFCIDKSTLDFIIDDLLGNPRDQFPDLGAYERIDP